MSGKVKIDGQVCTNLGTKVDPLKNQIRVDGKLIRYSSKHIYIIYNKPRFELVTKKDERGRRTIWESLSGFKHKLNAAGRLDFDSEGLLILTNDGGLIHRLTHPSFEVEKEYIVKVEGVPREDKLNRLRRGVSIGGVVYSPASITIKKRFTKSTWLLVSLKEGKNREIRKMFEYIGCPVLRLKRIRIGPVKLGNLPPGKWRHIDKNILKILLKKLGIS